ncbi:hypothetical protein GCM10022197_41720 [Microlunatus spumicola]|uniref:Uncharacterized protein n=1 Tax=Microlunatus spumicola TaxID=81499 RepID=A0ABP6Y9S8_9ACTN
MLRDVLDLVRDHPALGLGASWRQTFTVMFMLYNLSFALVALGSSSLARRPLVCAEPDVSAAAPVRSSRTRCTAHP